MKWDIREESEITGRERAEKRKGREEKMDDAEKRNIIWRDQESCNTEINLLSIHLFSVMMIFFRNNVLSIPYTNYNITTFVQLYL